MLRLPRSTIRALIQAGFVSPARGPRKTWQFSFQDLIVLRTAQALADAKVPAQRITRSLKELRRQLPESMPMSGLAIGAVGKRVVVRDGSGERQVDSGQYLLTFEGDPAKGRLSVIAPTPASTQDPGSGDADHWLDRAVALEKRDAAAALAAYERAIAADPQRLDARINHGRLLHEAGKLEDAERAYRAALADCGDDALLYYNLAVLLEDLGRKQDAVGAYEQALRADPSLADGHYNLALLYEQLGQPREAIRHMARYRRLAQ